MDVFAVLIVVMVSQVYTHIKPFQIVHFEYAQLIIWQLYLNEGVKNSRTAAISYVSINR